MSEERGQGDPVAMIVGVVVTTIVAMLAIYLFSEFQQTITITGTFAGTAEDLLIDTADILSFAVGGAGVAVTILLILRGAGP